MKKLLVVLVGSLLCCMSCGSDDCPTCPRPPGASGSPPQLANLACVPDSAPAEGTGSITIDCSMTFSDQDGDLDAVTTVLGQDRIELFLNESTAGAINFTQQAAITVGDAPRKVRSGDLNGDTFPDLVVSNSGTTEATALLRQATTKQKAAAT